MENTAIVHEEGDTNSKLFIGAVQNKNNNNKNGMRLKLIWAVVCITLLLVALFIPHHTEKLLSGPSDITNEPTSDISMTIIDRIYYSGLYTPYAILQINCVTDEVIPLRTQEGDLKDYNKVECNVIYDYHTDRYNKYFGDFSSISDMYIIAATAEELVTDDVIFINVEEQFLNGIYYFSPVTNNDGAEYISIIDDHIVLNGDEDVTRSFQPLLELNQLIYNTKECIERGGETWYNFDAFPQNEFQNGMTMDDLIDYLSAWENVREISDMNLENQSVPY